MKHLKVTKSANKAVISEAVDRKNTAVTLKGRAQCDEAGLNILLKMRKNYPRFERERAGKFFYLINIDPCTEDDYGYESRTSAGLYEKLMSKYEADPDDPMAKFSKSKARELKDIQGAKDRVKQALRREEELITAPGKRG